MAVDLSGLIASLENDCANAADDATQKLVDQSNLAAPRDTGELSEGGVVTQHASPGAYITTTAENPTEHASFQDLGTGGSTGNPWLVFRTKGGGWVKVRQTAPVPATRFWSDTFTDENWADTLQGSLDIYLS